MNISMNIPFGIDGWEAYFEILYPEYFFGVELPADYLGHEKLSMLLRQNNHKIVNVVELMEPSLIRNAAEQGDFVKDDIFEHLNNIILKKSNYHIDSFLVDLGFSPLGKNIKEKSQRLAFLKKFASSLYQTDSYITLPVSINTEFKLEEYSDFYINLITESMFSRFKLTLNISPHEIKKTILPSEIYNRFIFDVKNIRLIYEPDTGNYLSDKLLKYWLKPLKNYNYTGDIIIVPKTANEFVFESEIKKLTTILEKFDMN